jgi:NAD(P)H-hydrate repair Nnr-like enzyme with NAD(P)H-hydrate dehydratase domain
VLDADGPERPRRDAWRASRGARADVLTPARRRARAAARRRERRGGRARLRRAREAAEQATRVVVLKGDDTLVAEPAAGSRSARAARPRWPPRAPGDVLSGVIARDARQGPRSVRAACAGVRLHLDAGRPPRASAAPTA